MSLLAGRPLGKKGLRKTPARLGPERGLGESGKWQLRQVCVNRRWPRCSGPVRGRPRAKGFSSQAEKRIRVRPQRPKTQNFSTEDENRDMTGYTLQRLKIREPLVPPNPKLLESA